MEGSRLTDFEIEPVEDTVTPDDAPVVDGLPTEDPAPAPKGKKAQKPADAPVDVIGNPVPDSVRAKAGDSYLSLAIRYFPNRAAGIVAAELVKLNLNRPLGEGVKVVLKGIRHV